jgi:hypothetical protein
VYLTHAADWCGGRNLINCTTGTYDAVQDVVGLTVRELRHDHVTGKKRVSTTRRIPWSAIKAVEYEDEET